MQGAVEEHGYLQILAPGVTTSGSQQLAVKYPKVAARNYDTIDNLLINQPNTTTSEYAKSLKVLLFN